MKRNGEGQRGIERDRGMERDGEGQKGIERGRGIERDRSGRNVTEGLEEDRKEQRIPSLPFFFFLFFLNQSVPTGDTPNFWQNRLSSSVEFLQDMTSPQRPARGLCKGEREKITRSFLKTLGGVLSLTPPLKNLLPSSNSFQLFALFLGSVQVPGLLRTSVLYSVTQQWFVP